MNSDISSQAVITISKQQLSALPAAQFSGELHLVEDEEGIKDAIDKLRASDIIGFDTETRPSFRKGQSNNVSLVQLSTRETCYLFRINHVGLAQPIVDILEDPSIRKIGLSIHDDFHNLNKITEIHPGGFIELQNYVKDFLIADNSLTKIYAIIFGKRISKSQRLTNWEAKQLTNSQQAYAALDAMACVEIYDYISSGKFTPLESPYLTIITEEEEEEEERDSCEA